MMAAATGTFIPNPLLVPDLPYDVSSPGHKLASSGGAMMMTPSATDIPPMMREQTINKVFQISLYCFIILYNL